MFVDATECVMQVIEHRVSRIQHRSFDGNYFASNCNADLIEFMQRWGKLDPVFNFVIKAALNDVGLCFDLIQ